MKDNNLLGRNIQRLREIHGDTLVELGAAIGFAKSTIKRDGSLGYNSVISKALYK